ncbi:MAG: phytoene desaturase family protein [Flavobacteriaceae bacterium]|jgi:phytoene desaturase
MKKRAVIIGSGVAGLACSIRLAARGVDVTVLEANAYPGGKLTAFELNGYRFDAGPSLFTMPQWVLALFELAKEDPNVHFKYKRKTVACHYFWEDDTQFFAPSNRDEFAVKAAQTFGVNPQKILSYFKRAEKKFKLTRSLFLEQSLHKLKTFLSLDTLKAIVHLNTYQLHTTLHQANRSHFKNPKLVQLFDRYATYNGSSPYETSGMMTLIQHLEQHYGTYIPEGGMHQITLSLFALAKRLGVQFHFDTRADEILTKNNQVEGVKAGEKFYPADQVVSNMDVVPTYAKLLPQHPAPQKIMKQERSSAAVIFYWGITKEFPQLDLHNIFFAKDYQAEFEAIFKDKKIAEDCTVYVNITSKDVPQDAPKGCENWFVMINTPADYGQDWEALVQRLRTQVLTKLSKRLKTELEPLIACEEILTPPLIEQKTQSYKGALYGSSSNKAMAAFLRHPNFSQQIKNLYFCGGSVHPGGGIPLCLLSAKIVDELSK